jgi:tryptophanyl-tRNA synthetase
VVQRITGFKPTGHLHLGNYLGAIRPLVAVQHRADSVAFIADLHALTVTHDPARVRSLTLEVARLLLAAGVDPEHTLLYVQSHVPAHSELHYLLECTTGYGEAHRMIQFKEKAGKSSHTRLSLLTYPVLMASDVLLHDAAEVPVGDDQSQHVELARDIATRFNAHYGQTFVVPRAVNPEVAARLKDLADPGRKMEKTNPSAAGVLFLLDPPEVLRRKVSRAVTDTFNQVRHDPGRQPGVTNLLDLLTACTGQRLGFSSYGQLKAAVADAVLDTLVPVQERFAKLDEDDVVRTLRAGAATARERTAPTLAKAKAALGLR